MVNFFKGYVSNKKREPFQIGSLSILWIMKLFSQIYNRVVPRPPRKTNERNDE